MRYLLEIAYRGTRYSGWQKQPNAHTIQQELEKALYTVLREKIEVIGSGRTDSGVHAEKQVAHFDINYILDEYFYKHKINGVLPWDIAIKRLIPVKNNFHARFDAISRTYEYRIIQEKNPFLRNLSFFFPNRLLDLSAMNEAAGILMQYDNFQSFSKIHTDVFTYNCIIYENYWELRNDVIVYTIKADRFLRGMVRAITGTMLDIGSGNINISDFHDIIKSRNRNKAGRALPAEGLFLNDIKYSDDIYK